MGGNPERACKKRLLRSLPLPPLVILRLRILHLLSASGSHTRRSRQRTTRFAYLSQPVRFSLRPGRKPSRPGLLLGILQSNSGIYSAGLRPAHSSRGRTIGIGQPRLTGSSRTPTWQKSFPGIMTIMPRSPGYHEVLGLGIEAQGSPRCGRICQTAFWTEGRVNTWI